MSTNGKPDWKRIDREIRSELLAPENLRLFQRKITERIDDTTMQHLIKTGKEATSVYLGQEEFEAFRAEAPLPVVTPTGIKYNGMEVYIVTYRNHFAVA